MKYILLVLASTFFISYMIDKGNTWMLVLLGQYVALGAGILLEKDSRNREHR